MSSTVKKFHIYFRENREQNAIRGEIPDLMVLIKELLRAIESLEQ